MACADLPSTPGTQLHAQLLHEVHAPKPKAKRRKRGRARGARGGGGFATAGRPTAFSPPGTWSSAPGWGQAPRDSVFNARGQAPSTLHWGFGAPPAPLVRTESLIAAAEASGQEACAPAGAVDFFGSNVHRGLRFVRDDDDSSGSEHEMEEDEDAAGRKGGDAAGAQARAATAQQEYQALALENQRLSAEVALLRSALLAARQGSAGAVEPPLRDKDELELSTRNAALLFATAPA